MVFEFDGKNHLFGSACPMATMAAMAKMAAGALPAMVDPKEAMVDPTPTDLTILLSNALTPARYCSEGVLGFKNGQEYFWGQNEREAVFGGWVEFEYVPPKLQIIVKAKKLNSDY